jgi:hypothetical protein
MSLAARSAAANTIRAAGFHDRSALPCEGALLGAAEIGILGCGLGDVKAVVLDMRGPALDLAVRQRRDARGDWAYATVGSRSHDLDYPSGQNDAGQWGRGQVGIHRQSAEAIGCLQAAATFGQLFVRIEDEDVRTKVASRGPAWIVQPERSIRSTRGVGVGDVIGLERILCLNNAGQKQGGCNECANYREPSGHIQILTWNRAQLERSPSTLRSHVARLAALQNFASIRFD